MKSVTALVFAAFCLVGTPPALANSGATMEALLGETHVTLALTECPKTGLIAQLIGAEDIEEFKGAVVVYKGAMIKACWAPLDANSIIIVDELGSGGVIAKNRFSKSKVKWKIL